MSNKLYVGSLPYATTEADLTELFGQVGTVQSAKIIMNPETGQSKGFGFVEMASEDEANAAIVINEAELSDPNILVESINNLLKNDKLKSELSKNINKFAIKNGADNIVTVITKIAGAK